MSWLRRPETVAARSRTGTTTPGDSTSDSMIALWEILALDPAALEAVRDTGLALMEGPSPLSRAQVELLALVVSATNGCAYAVAHYGPRLARALSDDRLARHVALDYREANLAARDRVLLDYAVALTCEPSERKQDDVDRVREYGFDDAAILRATQIAAFVGWIDRLASGLGVELEPGVEPWEFGTQR